MKKIKIKNLYEKDIENLRKIKISELKEMKIQDLKVLKVKIEIDNKEKEQKNYIILYKQKKSRFFSLPFIFCFLNLKLLFLIF